MKALLCEAHGLPETLVSRDVPVPEPGPGEVRIAMTAAGVNFPDALMIQNLYQVKPALPFAPGGEVAGIIDAVGMDVDSLAVGDRVVAMTTYGAFAEQVVVAAARVLRIPDTMAFDVAAGFLMAYGTSCHALKQRAALQPGETLLVLGAAGGVGLAAVEIGKVMGAHVIAAASSDDKLAIAKAHGADEGINYTHGDIREAIKTLTDGKGVDVVFDPIGGHLAEPVFRSIARDGRYLVIGFAAGDIPSLPLNLPLLKSASIVGVFWGSFIVNEPEKHRQNMEALFDWYAAGALKPHIDRHFPLDDGSAAIRWVMDRRAKGKVIITRD